MKAHRVVSEIGSSQRVRIIALVGTLVAIVVAVVWLSPFALGWLSDRQVNWTRLSEVGQTYGTASAIIAAFALLAVGFSLIFQMRELRQGRIQALREMHSGLLKLALNEPTYMQCWGHVIGREGPTEKLFVYANLIVSYWEAKWDLRSMDSQHARRLAADFFASEIPREYWKKYGITRELDAGPSNRRKFYEILNEEYWKAIASGPPERSLSVDRGPTEGDGANNVSAYRSEQSAASRILVETVKIGATAIALWMVMRSRTRRQS